MIAYTLFVHTELNLVTRLIDELHNDIDYFYVHVDLQNKAMWRALCERYAPRQNVEVTSHHSLVWGGISLVNAQLHAIRHLMASDLKWSHIVNLSGQDYPLKSSGYIRKYLNDRPGRNFIESFDLRLEWPRALQRVKYRRIEATFPVKKVYWTPIIHTGWEDFDWRGGSQWWALNRGACKVCVQSEGARELNRFLTYSKCPDELFFQTLLVNDPTLQIENDNLRYIKWRGELGNRPRSPLSYADTASIPAAAFDDPDKLFIRKLIG